MAIRLSRAQAARLTRPVRQPPKALPARQRYEGYASAWEHEYAAYLTREVQARRIVRWVYEPLRFLLAHKTTYVPDFLVEPTQGKLQIHEVKGYFYPKDRIKVKVTARMFLSFRFLIVRKVNNQWEFEEIPG